LLTYILSHLDGHHILIEPFAGSGVVFLNGNNPQKKVADINPDLINLFQTLQNKGQAFIDECEKLFIEEDNKEKYYSNRKLFNSTKNKEEKSALFVYLNRHCYNGLWRYNANGEFNVAYRGDPKETLRQVNFPRDEIEQFCQLTKNVEFFCCSFEKMFEMADENCVIYADPPYVPMNSTSNFTGYSKEGFGKESQKTLADHVRNAPCRVVVSNRDTEFIREIYSGMKMIELSVQRNISCKGDKRLKDKELLIVKEKYNE